MLLWAGGCLGDSVTNTHLATHTAGYSVKKSLASPPSSVVERQTFNLVVVGSIPTVGLEHLIKFLGSTSGSRYQGRYDQTAQSHSTERAQLFW